MKKKIKHFYEIHDLDVVEYVPNGNNLVLLERCMNDTRQVLRWLDSIIYGEQIGKEKPNGD